MKTFLNADILPDTKGILYLCKYNFTNNTITVVREIQYTNAHNALNAYANIPNPESQLALAINGNSIEVELQALHDRLNNPKWVEELADYL